MKRKLRWSQILLIGSVLLAAGLFTGQRLAEVKPFRDLRAEEIASVTVELYSPDVTLELTREEIGQLVPILNRASVYRRDNSYSEYCGQAVVYTITRTDGTCVTVQAYNPFLVINGVGYRTKYGPCEELSQLGNDLYRKAKGEW